MKKLAFILILMMTAVASLILQIDWNSESFTDTLTVNPEDITTIELSLPRNNHYRSSRDPERIEMVLNYMADRDYQKIRGEPSELSMSASTLYLYKKDKKDFIVVFGDKIMVNQQFYKVKNNPLNVDQLTQIYQSLD